VFLDHVTEFLASDNIKLRDLSDAAASASDNLRAKKAAALPPALSARRRRHSVAKNP
jgi:hypothetical protein